MYINIGNRREVIWDDFLIDKKNTTATLVMHKPIKKELAFILNKPHEGEHTSYPHCIKVDEMYYMYYTTSIPLEGGKRQILGAVVKSTDMKHWEYPDINQYSFDGHENNNFIIHMEDRVLDSVYVFRDENPQYLPEERFKAVCMCFNEAEEFPADAELWCFTSPDGLRFKRAWKMADGSTPNGGRFDTLNITWYDVKSQCYKAYVRGLHPRFEGDDEPKKYIRDIRYMESTDFKNWSIPQFISYGEQAVDYPMYTNQVQRYYRAPHMYIGFPTRYLERKGWNKNFEQLGGEKNVSKRKEIINKGEPRSGLALTDCVFMSSRDGLNWNRWDEMFMGPGMEHERNWIYGDSSYPMYNLFETSCEAPSESNEISMYMHEGHQTADAAYFYRYAIRVDGFASYHSGYDVSTLETKPFIFSGQELSLNFETSAVGFVYVEILDVTGKPIEGYYSCEMFGNTLDRTVYFGEDKDVSKLSGLPIKLRFTMRDADIYSFIFR